MDNNKISQKLLKNIQKIKKYTLSIIDEVQDFTEINLRLLTEISVKIFAVGDDDALVEDIVEVVGNPCYFVCPC